MKKQKIFLTLAIFYIFIHCSDIFAKTISNINPCEFSGVLRLLKLLGILIVILKILIPLILIIMCIKDCTKPIMSGKSEDLSGLVPIFFRRIAAGIIIFFIPTIVNYFANNLVEFDSSDYKACTVCLLEPNSCVIPDKDPDTYKED